jgi:hypothetical protein
VLRAVWWRLEISDTQQPDRRCRGQGTRPCYAPCGGDWRSQIADFRNTRPHNWQYPTWDPFDVALADGPDSLTSSAQILNNDGI